MTNRDGWKITALDIKRMFGIRDVSLINDFLAVGYGLMSLESEELVVLQVSLSSPLSRLMRNTVVTQQDILCCALSCCVVHTGRTQAGGCSHRLHRGRYRPGRVLPGSRAGGQLCVLSQRGWACGVCSQKPGE